MKANDILREKSSIKETTKAFGTLTAAYGTFLDLGKLLYRGIFIYNDTNQGIGIRFNSPDGSKSEITLDASESTTIDTFYHSGLVEVKYLVAPSSGSVKMRNW